MKLHAISVLVAGLLPLVVMTIGCDGISGKQTGMVVIYVLDTDKASSEDKLSDRDMQALMAAIDQRLNLGGSTLGHVRQLDDGRIEVSIFRAELEEMQRIADLLTRPGTLEFRILANDIDHSDIIELAKKAEGKTVKDATGKIIAEWVPVTKGREDKFSLFKGIATRTENYAGKETLEILVVIDPFNVTGEYLCSTTTTCFLRIDSRFMLP